MKNGDKVKYSKDQHKFSFLTHEKEYTAFNVEDKIFTIIDDMGHKMYCRIEKCEFLKKGNWQIVEK